MDFVRIASQGFKKKLERLEINSAVQRHRAFGIPNYLQSHSDMQGVRICQNHATIPGSLDWFGARSYHELKIHLEVPIYFKSL